MVLPIPRLAEQWSGPDQVVLAHTPFRSLAASLGSKPVLVAGMGEVADVASAYGFRHVVTTHDLARALPSAVPFWKDTGGAYATT